jgi:hypothetical protein
VDDDDRGRTRRSAGALLLTGAVLLVAGCSGGQDATVEQVAATFSDPGTGPEARCALLVPSAAAALAEEGSAACAAAMGGVPAGTGPVESVEVWGGEAQVRLSGDTLFLTETPAGWRITAADCRASGYGPYRCGVEAP